MRFSAGSVIAVAFAGALGATAVGQSSNAAVETHVAAGGLAAKLMPRTRRELELRSEHKAQGTRTPWKPPGQPARVTGFEPAITALTGR